MTNCIICDCRLTPKNDSCEHIIPNALGGFRKVRGFLCDRCNNKTGHSWDAAIASQLNGLCHFFDIKRERGPVPAEIVSTTAGETFRMLPQGGFALPQPTVEKTEVEGKTLYKVVARDMSEARRILLDLQKKFPRIDAKSALENMQAQRSYPEGMIRIPCKIGGIHAGRSIVKSAVALVHDSGVPAEYCDKALLYLRDEKAPVCFGYYSSTDLLNERPVGVPLHCVAVSGNSITGLLLGYVEYFGFLRVVVLLSENYTGPDFENNYAVDPTTGVKLDIAVRLQLSRAEIEDISAYKHFDDEAIKQAADAVFGPGIERKRQRELSYAVNEALQYASENCGARPGDIFTEEQLRIVAQLTSERLIPFFLNLNKVRPLPPGSNLSCDIEG